MYPDHLAATTLIILAVFATSANCGVLNYNQRILAEENELMLDPTAKYKYFKKVDDMTFVKPEFMKKLHHDEKRSKRLVYNNVNLWPNGTVPYVIATSYNEEQEQEILRAMSHWEENTCIRFVERTTETSYLEFFKGSGCQSFIGNLGGKQGLSLTSACIRDFHLILHEIGHALGFLHEHSRPDRDEYVGIQYDNIILGFEREFYKKDQNKVNTLGVGYDYNSIMHYNHDTFSRNKGYLSTIVAHDPKIPVGGAAALSKLDIIKTNILYNCPDVPPPRSVIFVDSDELFVMPPVSSNCGDVYTNFSGIISSPGYPVHQGGQNCTYQIRITAGYQLRIMIKDLGISASPNCEESYLDLYDKLDCTGYRIARLCPGNIRRRKTYYFFENSGCVRYYSGNSSKSDLTGFKIDYSGDDINECFFPHICDNKCHNEPGGYYCSCPRGYFLSANGRTCFDVNECALNNSHMCEYKCKNFGGYHQCICPDGSIQGNGKRCPQDKCKGRCEHLCINTDESYTCSCRKGYILAGDNRSCKEEEEMMAEETSSTTEIFTTNITTEEPEIFTTTEEPSPLPVTIMTTSIGLLKSPNHPETYPNNIDMKWKIICPNSNYKKIIISFISPFGIAGRMPDCQKDYLRVRNSKDNSVLHAYCHRKLPVVTIYPYNTINLEFHAGPQHDPTRKGFKLYYICSTI